MLAQIDAIDVTELETVWLAFDGVVRLRSIASEADYDRTIALMNRVLEVVGDDETHTLNGLLDLITALVMAYEDVHYPMGMPAPDADVV